MREPLNYLEFLFIYHIKWSFFFLGGGVGNVLILFFLKDLESIDKKLEKSIKASKGNDKEILKTIEVLKRFKEHIEQGLSARSLVIDEDDLRFVEDLNLLTLKPVLYACNVSEADAKDGNEYVGQIKKIAAAEGAEVLVISAKIESEIVLWKMIGYVPVLMILIFNLDREFLAASWPNSDAFFRSW